MDIREAVSEYRYAKLRLSGYTAKRHRYLLEVFTTWCEEKQLTLETITVRHIRAFIEDVSKRPGKSGGTLKSSSVRCYAQTVKAFLAWCASEEDFDGLVSTRVVARIELPKVDETVIEVFTPEHIKAMFDAAEKQPFPVRDKALLCVLLDTGARAGEVCSLTLDCVWLDADDSYIKVMGKGRKEREIALGRTSRIALRRYITRYRHPATSAEKRVFLGRTGKPLTTAGVHSIVHDIGERAHIKGVRVSPHTWRHTMACMALLNGLDIYKLSRIMGHTSVKVTERYLSAVKAKQARQGESVLDRLKKDL